MNRIKKIKTLKNIREVKTLKYTEQAGLRTEILELQDGKCPVCLEQISEQTSFALDHQHKLKKEQNVTNGNGLIRGVLCRRCNFFEGKVHNNLLRFYNTRTREERILVLQNLIKYYSQGWYPIIHPREKEKVLLSKSKYNELKKIVGNSQKMPAYPKSGCLTLSIKRIADKFNFNLSNL